MKKSSLIILLLCFGFLANTQNITYSYTIKVDAVSNAAEFKDFEVMINLRELFEIKVLPKFDTSTTLFSFNSKKSLSKLEFEEIIRSKGYALTYWESAVMESEIKNSSK